MNRIYQGRVSKVEISFSASDGEISSPIGWERVAAGRVRVAAGMSTR